MLLARVAVELRTDSELSERLLPVRFMEESQEIFNLADFWLESLFHLAREQAKCDPDLSRELRDVHAALAVEWRGWELEERARAAVLETADRLGRQLVLMVENLQSLCRDVDDDFGWKLRKVLQSEPQIILLATATSRFRELDDAQHAFFELFRTIRLEPLDTAECRRLWQMVSGDTVSKRGIRPLQILTGGSPRLLIIIGEFAQHRSLRQLMEEIVKLVDDHTEYFRSHLEGFAKAERRVYLATIDLWQPSTTGEVAARARMDVRAVSALLGRLVERGAVIVEGSGRKRMYAAAERLYSIYYKLRRERDEAAVVRNLIHFMAVFYSETELADFAGRLRSEAARWPAIRAGIERAIAEIPQIGRVFANAERQSTKQTSDHTAAMGGEEAGKVLREDISGVLREATSAAERAEYPRVIELADLFLASLRDGRPYDQEPVVAPVLYAKAIAHENLGEHEFAITTYDQVIDCLRDNDNPWSMVLVANALFSKGITHDRLGDAQAEMATYDEVVERFGDGDMPDLQVLVAMALVNKGVTHGQIGDAQAEIATYNEVVERFGDGDVPDLQVQVAMALVNKGVTHGQIGDAQAEIATYDGVVERFGDGGVPELQVQVAKALVYKGITHGQIGDAQAEIATYDEVVERFGDGGVSELQVQVAKALFNKGVTHGQIGDAQAEIATYDEVVERFDDVGVPELQVQVAKALVNKGVKLGQIGDAQAEIATYNGVVEKFGDSDVPDLQVQVAMTLVNKGVKLGQIGDAQAEIATYDEVVERFGDGGVSELQVQVAKALVNKGITHGQIGDAQAEIATYDEVVERFGDGGVPELQVQVAKALVNKGVTYGRLDDTQAELAAYDQLIGRFRISDVPVLQISIAKALINKGIAHLQLRDAQEALATHDEIIERFGNSDIPELQIQVAKSLVNKAEAEIRTGGVEEALRTCDEIERRIRALTGNETAALERRAKWLRTKALLVLKKHSDAMGEFRSVYAVFLPSDDTMVREMLGHVPNLIAAGARDSDLVEVLSGDKEKADALLPLVVALRQHAGETVRAPTEVLEIAADIRREFVAARAESSDTDSRRTPSA